MLLPNMPPPVEGIHHQEGGIRAYVNQREMGFGTLFIAESHISWSKDGEQGGFSLQYPHIAVHAVTRDTSRFPHPCLYLALDVNIEENSGMNGHNEDDDDEDNQDEEDEKMSEIRFVPSGVENLDNMYKALNECQVLHPDPTDSASEDEQEEEDEEEGHYDVIENGRNNGDYYFNENYEGQMEDDLEEGNDENMEEGRFDDAEM